MRSFFPLVALSRYPGTSKFQVLNIENLERKRNTCTQLHIHDSPRSLLRKQTCVLCFPFYDDAKANESIDFLLRNQDMTDQWYLE